MTTAVAAAASVPSSLTSTNALCRTAEIISRSAEVMPEKSAFPRSNAEGMPIALSTGSRLSSFSVLNRGSDTRTGTGLTAFCHPSSFSVVSPCSSFASPSAARGRSTTIDSSFRLYGSSSTWRDSSSAYLNPLVWVISGASVLVPSARVNGCAWVDSLRNGWAQADLK